MCLAVKETCSGKLGLADCSDPETKWVNAGGQLLSALCWTQGISAALSVDGGCTDLKVDSSETFLLLGSDSVESIIVPTESPTVSSAPSEA